jgi:hypothetical protein
LFALGVVGAGGEEAADDEFVDFAVVVVVEGCGVDVGYRVDWGVCFVVVFAVAGGAVSAVE